MDAVWTRLAAELWLKCNLHLGEASARFLVSGKTFLTTLHTALATLSHTVSTSWSPLNTLSTGFGSVSVPTRRFFSGRAATANCLDECHSHGWRVWTDLTNVSAITETSLRENNVNHKSWEMAAQRRARWRGRRLLFSSSFHGLTVWRGSSPWQWAIIPAACLAKWIYFCHSYPLMGHDCGWKWN